MATARANCTNPLRYHSFLGPHSLGQRREDTATDVSERSES